MSKSICGKHDRAYETTEGCLYCVPEIKGAVAALAQSTPVAAVTCVFIPDWKVMNACGALAAWRWVPNGGGLGQYDFCDAHHNRNVACGFRGWTHEKMP